jgi:hypothetical protein
MVFERKSYEMEEPAKVTCNWCGWIGTENDIILGEDEDGDLEEFCPKCNKEGYLMDLRGLTDEQVAKIYEWAEIGKE